MDATVVRQFLDFIQDFLNLCRWKNWPNNETSEVEIKNAFLISQHVEKCLDKFQKNNLLHEFLAALDTPGNSLHDCLTDPPKFILKKIINSDTKVTQLDIAFKVFLQLFSEQKLENYLTDYMVEKASNETLLKNLSIELSQEQILKFKSELFLTQINSEKKECVIDLLNNCKQDTVNLLVLTLCNSDTKYLNSVNIISDCFLEVLLSKSNNFKHFWKLLFKVDDKYLIRMFVLHNNLFQYVCEALVDCGKLLTENMSAEYFYIDLTYSELVDVIKRLTSNEQLKTQFLDVLRENDVDCVYWMNIVS